MTGRTFETGGEVLSAGDTVIVFDGNSQKERKIILVGTQRVQIEGFTGNSVPYNIENRRSQSGGYRSYFRTKTEVAEMNRRSSLRGELRELGIECRVGGSGPDGFSPYSNETLEQMVRLLQEANPNKG